jgi:hypothetical protein
MRNREGMKVARARGPAAWQTVQSSARARKHTPLVSLHRAGSHTSAELAEYSHAPHRSTVRSNAPADAAANRGYFGLGDTDPRTGPQAVVRVSSGQKAAGVMLL